MNTSSTVPFPIAQRPPPPRRRPPARGGKIKELEEGLLYHIYSKAMGVPFFLVWNIWGHRWGGEVSGLARWWDRMEGFVYGK